MSVAVISSVLLTLVIGVRCQPEYNPYVHQYSPSRQFDGDIPFDYFHPHQLQWPAPHFFRKPTQFRAPANNYPLLNLLTSSITQPLYTKNPNAMDLPLDYVGCKDFNGMSGLCVLPRTCSLYGGTASGFCGPVQARVCCVSRVNICGSQALNNNTYWVSSSSSVNSNSSCGVSIVLRPLQIGQRLMPICQVRLDFESFNIAQPNSETVCDTDSFVVTGASNSVPTICGSAANQHMYLNVPSSTSVWTTNTLQMTFQFGSYSGSRSWQIKIAMLPCGANYLAPAGCLQYMSQASGNISSFNWADVSLPGPIYQLANQSYRICFRQEIINSKSANGICFSTCKVSSNQSPFSVSSATAGVSQSSVAVCNNDYLHILGGYDPSQKSGPTNTWDRYCGEALNPTSASATSSTVCTNAQPFSIFYSTNGDETSTPTIDTPSTGNRGFCLSFQQQ